MKEKEQEKEDSGFIDSGYEESVIFMMPILPERPNQIIVQQVTVFLN